jgi:hypothetical protein
VIPNSGHNIPDEAPEPVVGAVRSIFQETQAASADARHPHSIAGPQTYKAMSAPPAGVIDAVIIPEGIRRVAGSNAPGSEPTRQARSRLRGVEQKGS